MKIEEKNSKIKFSIDCLSNAISDRIAPNPSIRQKLIIQEPIRFPSAILLFPFIMATSEVMNSGKDVPKAIIVNPIILSEI